MLVWQLRGAIITISEISKTNWTALIPKQILTLYACGYQIIDTYHMLQILQKCRTPRSVN